MNKKGSISLPIIIVIVVVLILALGIGGYFYLRESKDQASEIIITQQEQEEYKSVYILRQEGRNYIAVSDLDNSGLVILPKIDAIEFYNDPVLVPSRAEIFYLPYSIFATVNNKIMAVSLNTGETREVLDFASLDITSFGNFAVIGDKVVFTFGTSVHKDDWDRHSKVGVVDLSNKSVRIIHDFMRDGAVIRYWDAMENMYISFHEHAGGSFSQPPFYKLSMSGEIIDPGFDLNDIFNGGVNKISPNRLWFAGALENPEGTELVFDVPNGHGVHDKFIRGILSIYHVNGSDQRVIESDSRRGFYDIGWTDDSKNLVYKVEEFFEDTDTSFSSNRANDIKSIYYVVYNLETEKKEIFLSKEDLDTWVQLRYPLLSYFNDFSRYYKTNANFLGFIKADKLNF